MECSGSPERRPKAQWNGSGPGGLCCAILSGAGHVGLDRRALSRFLEIQFAINLDNWLASWLSCPCYLTVEGDS